MIVFDLKCDAGHVFEAWFGSSESFEDQRRRGLVACAYCGSVTVDKAAMAPRLSSKGNRRSETYPSAPPDTNLAAPSEVAVTNAPAAGDADSAKLRAVLLALAEAQARALRSSRWVGKDFAQRARAMHYGDEDHAAIHGQASPDEAAALIDEGVSVAALPFAVIPPEAKN